MPEITYETNVFSLNSALGSQATHTVNATSRNRLVLEGSRAAFKMGHRRSHTAPWDQPPLSLHPQEYQSVFSGPLAEGFAHPLVPSAEIELMESNFDEMRVDSGGGNDFAQYIHISLFLLLIYSISTIIYFRSGPEPSPSASSFQSTSLCSTDSDLLPLPYHSPSFSPGLGLSQGYASPALFSEPLYGHSSLQRFSPYPKSPVLRKTSSSSSLFGDTSSMPASPLLPILTHSVSNGDLVEVAPRSRTSKIPRHKAALKAMKMLQSARITATDLLDFIVQGKDEFGPYRRTFFSLKNRADLLSLFDNLWNDDKGNEILSHWMRGHAIDLVCDIIQGEMIEAKLHLQLGTKDVTADFLREWDIEAIMDPVAKKITPTFAKILEAATEPRTGKDKPPSSRA